MNVEIANRLLKLRTAKGLSQEELANALGISRQIISKWEQAETSPDTDNLICLAKLYGVSFDALLNTDQKIEDIIEHKKEQWDNWVAKPKRKRDFVSINKQGIHIIDRNGDEVQVGFNGIHISTKDFHYESRKKSIIEEIMAALFPVLTIIIYLAIGAIFNLWHPTWLIFLLIPLYYTIIEAIVRKRFSIFAYPVLVVLAYLLLGFLNNLWHPYWFLFMTIPIYYIIFNPIDMAIHKDKKHTDYYKNTGRDYNEFDAEHEDLEDDDIVIKIKK